VVEANRFVSATRPWELAKAERAGDADAGARLDGVLGTLVAACRTIASELTPFLPGASERIVAALDASDGDAARTLFPKFGPG
jgi:methionyl-tRNA synthetase